MSPAAYIAVRQAMGHAMRAERTLLVDFVRFLAERDGLKPDPGASGVRLGHRDILGNEAWQVWRHA